LACQPDARNPGMRQAPQELLSTRVRLATGRKQFVDGEVDDGRYLAQMALRR
jgi:hypothetical protein